MTINKKLAFAVASTLALASGAASAATLTALSVDEHSTQGLQFETAADSDALPGVEIVLGADYTLNDTITITISGAAVDTAAANPTFHCDGAGGDIAVADAVISFVQRVGNVYTYRVTQKEVANTTGLACEFGGTTANFGGIASQDGAPVTVESSQITGDISVAYSATTAVSNLPLDAGGDTSVEVATVVDQFTSEVDVALNGIIDVEDDRLTFTDGTDSLVLDITDEAASLTGGIEATVRSTTIVVNGSFSYIDTDGTAGCSNAEANAALDATDGAITINSGCTQITVLDDDGTANDITIDFLSPTGEPLSAQSFTAQTTFAYDDGTPATTDRTESDNYAAGAWTLNGASVYISYMPYGPNISQIIYAANRGTQAGEVNVSAFNQAGTACNFAAGTLGANRVAILSGAVRTGLEGCYGAGFTDRVAMTITVNVPAADVEVYSAYNVGGSDRGTVVNDSNGKALD